MIYNQYRTEECNQPNDLAFILLYYYLCRHCSDLLRADITTKHIFSEIWVFLVL